MPSSYDMSGSNPWGLLGGGNPLASFGGQSFGPWFNNLFGGQSPFWQQFGLNGANGLGGGGNSPFSWLRSLMSGGGLGGMQGVFSPATGGGQGQPRDLQTLLNSGPAFFRNMPAQLNNQLMNPSGTSFGGSVGGPGGIPIFPPATGGMGQGMLGGIPMEPPPTLSGNFGGNFPSFGNIGGGPLMSLAQSGLTMPQGFGVAGQGQLGQFPAL